MKMKNIFHFFLFKKKYNVWGKSKFILSAVCCSRYIRRAHGILILISFSFVIIIVMSWSMQSFNIFSKKKIVVVCIYMRDGFYFKGMDDSLLLLYMRKFSSLCFHEFKVLVLPSIYYYIIVIVFGLLSFFSSKLSILLLVIGMNKF